MFARSCVVGAALACATARLAAAQSSATGTIAARATVGATVTLSNPSPIDFGLLLAGQTSADVPAAFSSASAHAGSIQITFSDPVNLNVTIDPGGELTNQGVLLTTVLACGLGTSATDANAAGINCVNQQVGAPFFGRTIHTAFIFVGGHTTAPATAPAGVYNGTVTVRVAVTTG